MVQFAETALDGAAAVWHQYHIYIEYISLDTSLTAVWVEQDQRVGNGPELFCAYAYN